MPIRLSTFCQRYPVPLADLLLSPVLFREGLPFLRGVPKVGAPLMRDLAAAVGHQAGAIRTAMSRLRSSGLVQLEHEDGDQARYLRGPLARSVQELVASQLARPDGLTLVVFTFATQDARERHLVRETLRVHGFQRLAQNTYISGYIDAEALQATFQREGIGDHVFIFQTRELLADNVQERLFSLFDLHARARALRAFRKDLVELLDDDTLSGDDFTRRLLYAGPVHYRITFVEEPQLPASVHPPNYPLGDVVTVLATLAQRRAQACVRYFSAFEPRTSTTREES